MRRKLTGIAAKGQRLACAGLAEIVSDQSGQQGLVNMSDAERDGDRAFAARPSRAGPAVWKPEDGKARFSAVVRSAQQGRPQHVSVRGHAAVVVLAAADDARLAPAAAGRSLASLFGDSPFAGMDEFEDVLVRERAPVREPPDFAA
jgi:prevent-host-death family protein